MYRWSYSNKMARSLSSLCFSVYITGNWCLSYLNKETSNTIEEFLLDNRKLKVIPTLLSLMTTSRSAITVLGVNQKSSSGEHKYY